jgi:hypothetical protein
MMKLPSANPTRARISAVFAEIREWNVRILVVLLRVVAFLCFIPAFTCVAAAEWLSDLVAEPDDA